MDARQLLVDPHSHLPPAATLAGITAADATRRVAGLPHSIADVVDPRDLAAARRQLHLVAGLGARVSGFGVPVSRHAGRSDWDWVIGERPDMGLELRVSRSPLLSLLGRAGAGKRKARQRCPPGLRHGI